MPKLLTAAQLAQFRSEGFVFPLPGVSAAQAADYRARIEAYENQSGHDANRTLKIKGNLAFPWLMELARNPRILDAVEDVIGPNILVWTSTFFIKEPHSPTFAAWHQDGTYFGLEPKEQICAWVALTDATREAGCMEHVSSKGNLRQLHHAPLGLAHSINRAGQTIMEPFDDSAPVAMALPAGSFSLHHEFSLHRSAPNNAAHRRVGIGLNYVPTHVRVDGPVRCNAMLVRGEDKYGHFDLIEPPKAECDTAALAVHQEANDRYRANYKIQVERHEAAYAKA